MRILGVDVDGGQGKIAGTMNQKCTNLLPSRGVRPLTSSPVCVAVTSNGPAATFERIVGVDGVCLHLEATPNENRENERS